MTDDLRRQPRKVEQALVALEGVIAVRREYISLLQCLGTCDKKLTSLDALITARPGHVRSRSETALPRLSPVGRSDTAAECPGRMSVDIDCGWAQADRLRAPRRSTDVCDRVRAPHRRQKTGRR